MSILEISVIDLPCGKGSNVKVSSGIWRMWQMILSGRFMNLSRLPHWYVTCDVYYYSLKKYFLCLFVFSPHFFDPSSWQRKKTQFFIPSLGLIPTVCETRVIYERNTDLAHSILSDRGLERGIRSSEVPLLDGDSFFFVITFYCLPVLRKRLSIVEL